MMTRNMKLAIFGLSALALTSVVLLPAIGAEGAREERTANVRGVDGEEKRERCQPGDRWQKAAELQKTLSAEEKAKLLSRADSAHMRGSGGRPGHGPGMMGKGGRPEGMGKRPFGPRTPENAEAHAAAELDAMAAALGLSASQKSQVGELIAAHRSEAGKLMEELRSSDTDRETAHARMKDLRDRHQAALARILDPTQMEIVKIHDAIGGHHKGGRGRGHGGRGEKRGGATTPNGTTNPGGANIE